MHFKAFSAAVFGIDAYLVEVEVDVGSSRLGDFNVVGLPDVVVKEAANASRRRSKIAAMIFHHRVLPSILRPRTSARRGKHLTFRWRSRFLAARARSSASGSTNSYFWANYL
jgi:hypothetical protein